MRAISACCFSIARPSWISRAAASRRQACQEPGKKRVRPASISSTEVPTASRNQRSWATSTTAASRSVEIALEPLQRGDVEVVGGLVEQQQVRVPGQRARQRRAGELAAGEALEGPVESARRRIRGRGAGRAHGCASPTRRRARAAPGRGRSGRAPTSRPAARPWRTRGRAALPRAPRDRGSRRARSRAARGLARAEDAGRGGLCGCPWPPTARRRRSASPRRASAEAWSCRPRCARPASCGRGARA